jgi:hypothetical protein
MKKLVCFIAASLVVSNLASGQWVSNYWAPTYGDINFTTAKGIAVAVDNQGFCYVTGYVFNDLTANNDIVTIKYSQQGDTLWTRTYNGSDPNSDDQGFGVAADGNGNVYVCRTGWCSRQVFGCRLAQV